MSLAALGGADPGFAAGRLASFLTRVQRGRRGRRPRTRGSAPRGSIGSYE